MFTPAVIYSIAAYGRYPANKLAEAALHRLGDSWIELPLFDCLQEQGEDHMNGLEVGKCYYVETVTKYYVGELFSVDFTGISLVRASWIPDTGRYHQMHAIGEFREIEPLPPETKLFLPSGIITAITEWVHPLPSRPK